MSSLAEPLLRGPVSKMTLRLLRIWHWEKVLAASDCERRNLALAEQDFPHAKNRRRQAVQARREWNLHIGAVQALNDALGAAIGDTAEADLEILAGKTDETKAERFFQYGF